MDGGWPTVFTSRPGGRCALNPDEQPGNFAKFCLDILDP